MFEREQKEDRSTELISLRSFTTILAELVKR